MVLTARALWRNLLTIILILAASNATGAIDCGVQPWSVASEAELNEAIVCYNAKTVANNYTISLTQNINLTASSTAINNSTTSVTLLLEGNDFTVDGQAITGVRPFTVTSTATLQNITITGGLTNAIGGGILNAGSAGSTLIVNNCVIHGNHSSDNGGGIYNNGILTINNSTISDNTAAAGGGIYHPTSTLTINNSTISDNSATYGSGINLGVPRDAMLTINNSTLSGNTSAAQYGGGIFIGPHGATIINNSTLSGNYGGSTFMGNIGSFGSSPFTINNSILANSADHNECTGAPATGSNNLIEDSSNSCGLTNGVDGNIIGQDPLLGTLQDNGGVTFTHALLPGSPALDSGDPTFPTTGFDQRGAGFDRVINSRLDMGAYEAAIYTLTVAPGGTGSGLISSSPAGINCGVDCTEAYHDGTEVTVTAVADTGSTFTSWAGACSGTGSCIATMTAARSVTANFTLNSYAITETANPTAGGSVSCSPNPVDHDSSTSCSATANTGYIFTNWSGDCTGTGTCNLSNVTGVRSVTANFTLNSYTITETANPTAGGSVSCTPNPVDHDSSTNCSATANTGYTFVDWTGDCTGPSSCDLSNVTTAQSVTATFRLNSYAIAETANPVAGGSVSCTPNPVNYGSSASCIATPDPGFEFDHFSGDCSGQQCEITNVAGALSVTAVFVLLPVVPVPVISVWGLAGLAGLLALFGIGFSRRRA